MNKIRVGIVGCGQIAQMMHMPYINDSDDMELCAMCDISAATLNGCADRYKLPQDRRFLDYQEMYDKVELDMVVICTMDHYEPSIAASKAGICQLVEKPLAFNSRQAAEMAECARQNNVWIAVGYMKCYDRNYLYFRDRVKKMEGIKFIRVHDFGGNMDFTPEVYDLYSGRDIPQAVLEDGRRKMREAFLEAIKDEKLYSAYFNLLMTVSHDLSALRYLFGDPKAIDYVSLTGDIQMAVLDYGEFKCVLEGGWLDKRRIWDESITVYSDDATVSISFPWPYLKNSASVVSINEDEGDGGVNVDKRIVASYDEAYRSEWTELVKCFRENREPELNADGAAADIAIFEKMIQKYH